MTRRTVAVLSFAALAAAGCPTGDPPTQDTATGEAAADRWFVEITDEVGLAGAAGGWPNGSFVAPEIMGPGVGLFDADGDGDLDVVQLRIPRPDRPGSAAPNRLFLQLDDGRFVESTTAPPADPGFAQGVAAADYDDDGDVDLFFANWGADGLWRNEGAGRFVETTAQAGIAGDGWSSSAAWCDYDADGDLDLYVARYLRFDPAVRCLTPAGGPGYCDPATFDGLPDRLWRNEGGGRFHDATLEAGLVTADGGRRSKGLGVLCVDLTGDGRLDFYIANDGEPNQLWVNRGDGTFSDEAIRRGVAVNRHGEPEASMGLALADVNGDGSPALLMTHLEGENNTLYQLGDGPVFHDGTPTAGMAGDDLPLTGFGCAFLDFELDGDVDLAVVNGRVRRGPARPGADAGPFWHRFVEPNLLFVNDGGGRFASVATRETEFCSALDVSRGLVAGDLDNDGDLDLLLSNGDGSLRAYRNVAPREGHHWLRLRVMSGPRDEPGATVRVDAGTRRWLGFALPGTSYMSSGDPRVHFGLGPVDRVERVAVRWPDGAWERFAVAEVDREWVLRRGAGVSP